MHTLSLPPGCTATAAYQRLASDDDKLSLEVLSTLALNATDAARGLLAQLPVSPVKGVPQ